MSRAVIEASTPGQVAPLYPKLRPHPNGPSRAEVSAHQLKRLHGATIEAAAMPGYEETTVAELCRLAGVSKRTFYEQFANKEACFLGTYDAVLGCATERIEAAARAEHDWAAALRAIVTALARYAVDQPKAARLALLQTPCVRPGALARRDRAKRWFVELIAESFDEAPYGVALPPVVAKGIACGVERVVCRRLLEEDGKALSALADELTAWGLSYGSPALASLPPMAPASEARPPAPWLHAWARAGSERARILRASAEITAAEGYARLTPERIARRAEVSERAFRACYGSVEECFLGVLDVVGLEALMVATRASRRAGDGPAGACRAIAALMERVAGDPVLRSVAFVQVYAAGPSAIERSETLLGGFANLLARGMAHRPPNVTLEATVGAIWGVANHHVTRGTAGLLTGLAGHVAYLALAPVTGAEAAVETILAVESSTCQQHALPDTTAPSDAARDTGT